jgi:hypothetical protein
MKKVAFPFSTAFILYWEHLVTGLHNPMSALWICSTCLFDNSILSGVK